MKIVLILAGALFASSFASVYAHAGMSYTAEKVVNIKVDDSEFFIAVGQDASYYIHCATDINLLAHETGQTARLELISNVNLASLQNDVVDLNTDGETLATMKTKLGECYRLQAILAGARPNHKVKITVKDVTSFSVDAEK